LTDEQGAAVGGGKGVDEVWASFLVKRHQLQGNASGAGRRRDEDRINALSCDERNGSMAVKRGGQEGKRLRHGKTVEAKSGRRKAEMRAI
jgi:hypothetical protein